MYILIVHLLPRPHPRPRPGSCSGSRSGSRSRPPPRPRPHCILHRLQQQILNLNGRFSYWSSHYSYGSKFLKFEIPDSENVRLRLNNTYQNPT